MSKKLIFTSQILFGKTKYNGIGNWNLIEILAPQKGFEQQSKGVRVNYGFVIQVTKNYILDDE